MLPNIESKILRKKHGDETFGKSCRNYSFDKILPKSRTSLAKNKISFWIWKMGGI